jgi:hypothetical protein
LVAKAAITANDSTALRNANVDLRICMADVVCPSQVLIGTLMQCIVER